MPEIIAAAGPSANEAPHASRKNSRRLTFVLTAPSFCAARAAEIPARPPPTTATSSSAGIGHHLAQCLHRLFGSLGENSVAQVHDAARPTTRTHLLEQRLGTPAHHVERREQQHR